MGIFDLLFGSNHKYEAKIEYNELAIKQHEIAEELDELTLSYSNLFSDYELTQPNANVDNKEIYKLQQLIIKQIINAEDNISQIGIHSDFFLLEDNLVTFNSAGLRFNVKNKELNVYDILEDLY